jgi:hypothetical protein
VTPGMHRRLLLASLTAAVLAPCLACAATRYPLTDAFVLLDLYLALPPDRRSRFYLAYRAIRDTHPAPDAKASFVEPGGARTPVAIDADGFVTNPPNLAQLKSRAMFEVEGAPFKIGLEMRARMAPASQVDAAELALTLVQVNAAVLEFSGGPTSGAGRLTTAYFPDSGGGDALLADGRAPPLPVFDFPGLGPIPYFEAAKYPGAKAVRLAKPASRILFGGPPRKPAGT